MPSEAGREGEGRPAVSGGHALLFGSQHHLAGAAGAVRALEHGTAAISPSEPVGVFEDFFATLADLSSTAHLVQMFDSTVTRAHVTYDLKKGRKVVYRGTANDPERREREHRDAGLDFDRLLPTSRRMTPQGAKDREAENLERYRRNHGGHNPRYNKDTDG